MCEPGCIECGKGGEHKLLVTGHYKAIWECIYCGCVWMERWSKHKEYKSMVLISGNKSWR